MTLRLEIFAGSGEPIYAQLEAQVRRAVVAGALTEGEQLPSVRALAERLTVNPNTVARAYNELIAEGVLVARPGRGFFVAPRRQVFSDAECQRRLDAAIRAFLDEVALLGLTQTQIQARLRTLSAEYKKL
ncbi:MAG: GntR family transcriptional regulator [Verrucomicrobiales bacterium]|jgi:GntR family transcriptional regulator|nr:GntR family transcriptional regulator [Verrucomicrobiales bacterium]